MKKQKTVNNAGNFLKHGATFEGKPLKWREIFEKPVKNLEKLGNFEENEFHRNFTERLIEKARAGKRQRKKPFPVSALTGVPCFIFISPQLRSFS